MENTNEINIIVKDKNQHLKQLNALKLNITKRKN